MNDTELKELWEKNGFISARKLFKVIKEKHQNVKFAEINNFIKKQDVQQIHKPVRHLRNKETPIVSPFPKYEIQLDLIDMSNYSRQNKGNKWILVCVDVFSRKAEASAIKSKKPADVLIGMK